MNYVYLTNAAVEAFQRKLEKRGTTRAYIRLGLTTGCSGYGYKIAFEDDPPKARDIKFFYYGIRVLIDKKSIVILNGCTLDYKSSLKESGFVFSNPNAISSCGCGNSFGVK